MTVELHRGPMGMDEGSTGARVEERYLVQFYEDEEQLSLVAAQFLAAGLNGADVVIAIATAAHGEALQQGLTTLGVDVSAAIRSGRLTFIDAHETLAAFMRDGAPRADLFEAAIGRVVATKAGTLSSTGRIRAYGEMADILWREGHQTAAIHLEELWNEIQARNRSTLLCAHALGSFYKQPAELQSSWATQTHVGANEADPDQEDVPPARSTTVASQHTRRHEQEIARRIEVENGLRAALGELRAREAQLRGSEEQLRDLVENAAVAIHRVGPDGAILSANRAELDLLGYEEHEYVGRSIADFHADADVIEDVLGRLTRGEALQNYEARLRAKDGSIKHVLISSNVYARDGRFLHTRCFTRDITARREAEEALRQQHRQLQVITDALPILVALIDPEQRYQFASAGLERWFGQPTSQVVGRHVREVLGSPAYDAMAPHIERALGGERITFEANVPHRNGDARFIEATCIPQFEADGTVAGIIALVSDITQRKSFEQSRAVATERAERLLRITEAIAGAITPEEVFEALVDRVSEALAASSAGLWLIDEEQHRAKLARSRGYSEPARQRIENLPLDLSPSLPALDCIHTGRPVWVESQAALFERYPHVAAVATPGRSYRIACLPLVANERVLGTLALTIEQAREESADEREFLLLTARYATQAIERLRLIDAERRSRAEAHAAAARLEVLGRVSRTFAESGLSLGVRLANVASELVRTLNSGINISLIERDGLLHLAAMRHPNPEAQALLEKLAPSAPLRLREGVTGTIAATGESVLLPVIDRDQLASRAPEPYRAFLESHPVYAMIGAALRVQGRVIGTVTATRCREGETYTQEDLRLFEELGERAAAAIENARLYEESVAARKRAEQLYRFAQAVVAAGRVEDVFEAAITAVELSLGANRSAVLTFDDDGVLRFRAWRNLTDGYRDAVERHSPWPRDADGSEPVLVSDTQNDAGLAPYRALFRGEGIGAIACMPLMSAGRLLGKFMVCYEQPHAFLESDADTARAIANHLASVIVRFSTLTKLEETIRYNELFAGVLAHDLRNPLGAMVMAAQLLLMRKEGETAIAEREKKPLSRIVASGERMNTMIEQLLDFTRTRSGGGIPIEPHEADLADLCDQAVAELELAHPEWRIQRAAAGDQRGAWDSARLLQVFSNLIANACQHGNPDVPVFVKLDGAAEHEVRIEVRNGGTIPESLLPHLFDPFRSIGHRRDHSRGLGLGLFIIREIVRGHGGSVDVTSTELEGTSFVIQLPRQTQRRG